jgi:hypothetical protein
LLIPVIAGRAVQPIAVEDATRDFHQLEFWASEFPDGDWALQTGPESGVIVLEADRGCDLAAVQSLAEFDCPETLCAHAGNRVLAFFLYPKGMRSRQKGKIALAPGLRLRADDDQIILPHRNDGTWPDLDVEILETPEWLQTCASEPDLEES